MPDVYDPRDRMEVFLRGLLDGDGDLPDPETREELFLSAIAARAIPKYPDTDGTYTLKLTISDGAATLEWVSAS